MTKAFVLLNTENDRSEAVYEKLNDISSIEEKFRMYGVYDIIVLIEEPDMKTLKETVFHKIRKYKGVKTTLTLLVM